MIEIKPVVWVGSSRSDFRTFPAEVHSRMGYALYVAQQGGKHRHAKPLKGFGGAGVVERATSNVDKATIMQRLREAERIAAGAPG